MQPFQQHLLKKYSTLEYILLGDLRDLLEEQPGDQQTTKWLLVVLDALLDMLPREFMLEEEDGYLAEVVEAQPSWVGQVNALQEEHDRLFKKLKRLRNQLQRQVDHTEIAAELREGLHDWMRSLLAHNRNENRLMQTAANLDVGSGD